SGVWMGSAWEEDKAKEQVAGTDLIISIGGDGTILRAARIVVPWPIPILGINLGKLGFLTELSPQEALERVPAFLAGEGWVDERAMLQAELICGDATKPPLHALNDVVVARRAMARVVYVATTIDGELLTTYKGDGVVVATATGSTGYVLAAGGPILHPQSRDMVLKPLLPHLTLDSALVLPPDTILELEVRTDHQAVVSLDGQVDMALASGDRVRVKLSPHQARFLRSQPPARFYHTMAQKLGMNRNG
ncbi:MAG: NAD(+)/NADH kinase, partial [Chloroflexota bacterium]|nr:NAD(+)/NADH kinase [Chloroflexota bacterium]